MFEKKYSERDIKTAFIRWYEALEGEETSLTWNDFTPQEQASYLCEVLNKILEERGEFVNAS